MTIPDAPWIREAERDGYPGGDEPEPECPICGRICDDLYLVDGEIKGEMIPGKYKSGEGKTREQNLIRWLESMG